jgi:hypothetical protein
MIEQDEQPDPCKPVPESVSPSRRALILLAGLVLPQVVLFGSSLAGRTLLLPADILVPYYAPDQPETKDLTPHNLLLSDQVLLYEPWRRFASAEVRAGRLPLWNPFSFAGAPLAACWIYSPFMAVYYLYPSPVMLAWIQLAKSVIAGLGAYFFLRRVVAVRFWPAACGSWCYPLTGFFVLWQGYPETYTTAWYPWLLLATDQAVRRPRGVGGPLLALCVLLTCISGQLDTAGHALLGSGLYALWRWIREWRKRPVDGSPAGAAMSLFAGWGLGLLLAGPYLLPQFEYVATGIRTEARSGGSEERPPEGAKALVEFVLPNAYGTSQKGSHRLLSVNLLESGAATYIGLLATLLAAPLAWCSARHRALSWFWLVQIFITVSWVLNVPGMVWLLRLPGVNLLSHNRFVFVAGFALLALAATGLDVLGQRRPQRCWWWALPLMLLLAVVVFCAVGLARPPQLPRTGVPPRTDWAEVQRWFRRIYIEGMALACLGIAGYFVLWRQRLWGPWVTGLVGGLMVAELLWFGWDVNPQCDPALYYPPMPALTRLTEAPEGRIIGVRCFFPNLNMVLGLRDVRGYDGVDPARLVKLLEIARDPRFEVFPYARTQAYVPRLLPTPTGPVQFPRILSMLGVRYVVMRIPPPKDAPLYRHEGSYWILENANALPRVYIPRRVETVTREPQLLARLAEPDFDPAAVAYVEQRLHLPDACRGAATLVEEVPMRIQIHADMETPGLLILSDLWYDGWQVMVNGRPAEILRTNYALRGVVLEPGPSEIVFEYRPVAFRRALVCMLVAWVAWLSWITVAAWRIRRAGRQSST